jgi:hypothetical protein
MHCAAANWRGAVFFFYPSLTINKDIAWRTS